MQVNPQGQMTHPSLDCDPRAALDSDRVRHRGIPFELKGWFFNMMDRGSHYLHELYVNY